jgi:hypothetical protein
MNEVWMRFNANAYQGTSDKFLDVDPLPEDVVGKMETSSFGSNPLDATVQFNIKPHLDQFVSFYFDKTQFKPEKFDGENPVNLQLPEEKIQSIKIAPNFTQQLLYVGGSEYISSLGDLSLSYLDEFKIPKAKRLKDLVLGNDTPGYYNSLLRGFQLSAGAYNSDGTINENAKRLLEKVVLTNLTSLSSQIDISGSEKIKSFRALGTAIPSVSLADGCQIETLHLPKTIQSFSLVEPVALKGIITTKPIGLTDEQMPNGIYIEGLTDVTEFNSNSRTSIDSYSIIGGKMEYDSYKLLNNLVKIKQEMQKIENLENVYSKNLEIRLDGIHWSPYYLVGQGEKYDSTKNIYKQKTDHYTFVDYVYNENNWENDLLNEKVYIYKDIADKNLITDLSMLDAFIASYESKDNNYFKDTVPGIGGANTIPYLSGDIFINNTTPISETELKNKYKDKYFPDLNIFVANAKESYIAKFVEILDNGKEKE